MEKCRLYLEFASRFVLRAGEQEAIGQCQRPDRRENSVNEINTE